MKEKVIALWLKIKGLPTWSKWLLTTLLVIFIIGTLLSITGNKDTGVTVMTGKIEKRSVERSIISSGSLESVDKQEFFTPVDSTLMELTVEVGDRVKKGEVLGRLDTLELGRQYENAKANLAIKEAELAKALAINDELELAAAKAQYDQAKNHYDRTERLYNEGVVNLEEMESARVSYAQADANYQQTKMRTQQGATAKQVSSLQSQVDLAKQEVAQAKERLDLATFIAKEDGVVLFVGAEKGNRVLEGSRILVVGKDSQLEVTAKVNELDAGDIEAGQSAQVTTATVPDKVFNGEVTRVAAAAISEGEGNSSVPVTVTLQNNSKGLKPGYTVDLKIITMPNKEFLTVPFEAIISKNGQTIVYTVEDGIAKEKKIKTEPGNELFDIVVSGLKVGETVILNPPPQLKDGQPVVIGENR
ncbi:efflux RND transporter periplasmic adaptor subunit [Peptococcaceae bacterium 1198_IL3148]